MSTTALKDQGHAQSTVSTLSTHFGVDQGDVQFKTSISGLRLLRTSPLRPPSGVIPAQAGILTRVAFYKGHAVAVNYAGKSLKVRIILCLSCSLWCGSGRYVNQDARTLIKIPAFAGMTGERQE